MKLKVNNAIKHRITVPNTAYNVYAAPHLSEVHPPIGLVTDAIKQKMAARYPAFVGVKAKLNL